MCNNYPGIKEILENFEKIASIPRGSGNTKAICDYFVEFAKARGLEYNRDEYNNIIIRKPATPGHESSPSVIIQGHLDMVCDKEPDSVIDPEENGVKLVVEGDYISAEKTTLGADNGIALAYAMTILESDTIEHPAIEALFTSDEEIGMIGASALDTSLLKGRTLLNIDSEEEGYFTAACAGGLRADFVFPFEKTHIGKKAYKLTVSGLAGGHSGMEIDKGRANAYILLGTVLKEINDHFPVFLVSIGGGGKDNAIAKYACAYFETDGSDDKEIFSIVSAAEFNSSRIYKVTDPELKIKIEVVEVCTVGNAIENKRSTEIIKLFSKMPSGVVSMSKTFDGYVDTSLNLGIVSSTDKDITLSFSIRSFTDLARNNLLSFLSGICEKYNGSYTTRGEYPAWEYRENSHLRDIMTKCYKKRFGHSATVCPVHAGLECGVFASKLPNLDCISFGPNLYDVHTTQERMSISSVERTWLFILDILENL